MCCGQKRGVMQTSKVEIPANPTARDKGNGAADLLAQTVNESVAAVDDLAVGFTKSTEIQAAPLLPPRTAPYINVPDTSMIDTPKEQGDGKRRR